MPDFSINLTGPSDKKRSKSISTQQTVNFYTEKADETGENSDYYLQCFPGLTYFGTVAATTRGIFEHNDVLYRVAGTSLYSVDSTGAHTMLATAGDIPGLGRCSFVPMNSDFLVITELKAYYYDVSADTVTLVTDTDVGSPKGAAFLNQQIIYDYGSNGQFTTSDVGDAKTINGLNYGTAEMDSDGLVIPYVFDNTLYLMGTKTIEPWWNSGTGNPPFDRVEGAGMPVGLGAQFSAANNDKFLYFLADDGRVYRIQKYSYGKVSTISISNAVENYATISDAIGFCFTVQNQNFYFLSFPTENETWLYSEAADDWTNLGQGTTSDRHIAFSYAYCYRKHIIDDYRNGDLFYIDMSNYTENGNTIRRVRETGDVDGKKLGAPGKKIELERFELLVETGVGIDSGQGSDPQIMLETSINGGKTWRPERRGRLGVNGEDKIVYWTSLGSAYKFRFRISVSDPVEVTILGANASVEFGI